MREEAVITVAPVTDEEVDDRHAAYGLAAEVRAVEAGHNARVLPDGSVLVKSDSQPGSHRVWIRGISDGTLLRGCTCGSGTHRTWPQVRNAPRESLDEALPVRPSDGTSGVDLLVVRHAESTWNAEHRWAGQRDPGLSAKGRRDAAELARQLAALDPPS